MTLMRNPDAPPTGPLFIDRNPNDDVPSGIERELLVPAEEAPVTNVGSVPHADLEAGVAPTKISHNAEIEIQQRVSRRDKIRWIRPVLTSDVLYFRSGEQTGRPSRSGSEVGAG